MPELESMPWRSLYPEGVQIEPRIPFGGLVEAWSDRVARVPDAVAVRYFDGVFTVRELDAAADAFACALLARGVSARDRVGLHLQNTPTYVIALLAIWKVGATAVLFNPMYHGRDLLALVDDCRPVGIIVQHDDAATVSRALESSSVSWMVGVSNDDFQTRFSSKSTDCKLDSPVDDFADLLGDYAGKRPPVGLVGGEGSIALICYTSGTTGPPKGAMSTHSDVLHSALNFGSWISLDENDRVLAIAPMFHISGAILNAAVAIFCEAELVLAGRFHPQETIDAIREHKVTFTLGSITAFNALSAQESASPQDFASIRLLYSGGAPIPPSTVEAFENRFGHYIHNVWGMTETTAGGIAVPPGMCAPIDPTSGTLSIGVPTPEVMVRIVDPDGQRVPVGSAGELEFSAPQLVSGYWEKPEETDGAFRAGWFRTGDVAIMDREGWVYLVDRLKDQINSSGYKIWPREVEDVLYAHPEVHEVAVVGEPDSYRGECVVGYVSLKPGASTAPSDLIAFARERLAAYKVPRRIAVLDEIPKTATGKIRRLDVRGRAGS